MSDKTVKRKQLNIADKIAIIGEVDSGAKKADVCRKYNLPPSSLSTLLKNKEKLIQSFPYNSKERKRLKTTTFEDLDEVLLNWFKQQRNSNIPISGSSLWKEQVLSVKY
ncbi:CENP-B N-terminal DNA-binding domain [Popillia japonica]|uniref:CENP-B N-terminal DNA-binding domain n=1 Tax=Popillia japonica TaxID=7064 RepID=A0AAW1KL32_POPJA